MSPVEMSISKVRGLLFRCLFLLIVPGLMLGTVAYTQDMALPVGTQVPLFLKILSYDKNLPQRGEKIVLGVLYQKKYRLSNLTKQEVLEVMKDFETLAGHPIEVVPIALDETTVLSRELDARGVNVLYVAPVRAYDVSAITSLSRSEHLLTLTGVPDYVHQGLSVGLGLRAGRPLILINLEASTREGARFHSQLLRLAQIVE